MKTIDNLRHDAGDKLTDFILEGFNGSAAIDGHYNHNSDSAVNWYYNCHEPAVGNLTPAEYCRKNGKEKLYTALSEALIEHKVMTQTI